MLPEEQGRHIRVAVIPCTETGFSHLTLLWVDRVRLGLWTDICPPPAPGLALEVKQTFLSTSLACLLAFER